MKLLLLLMILGMSHAKYSRIAPTQAPTAKEAAAVEVGLTVLNEGDEVALRNALVCVDPNAAIALARMIDSGDDEGADKKFEALDKEGVCSYQTRPGVIGFKIWGGDNTKVRVLEVVTGKNSSVFVITDKHWKAKPRRDI